ncbi:hypothetical protein [Microcoleus sp. herbarium12]
MLIFANGRRSIAAGANCTVPAFHSQLARSGDRPPTPTKKFL